MTFTAEHAPNCKSLVLLTSHPPQTQACDCHLALEKKSELPKVVPFLRPVPGGAASPPSQAEAPKVGSVPEALRKLADQIESGELPPAIGMICIPIDDVYGTDSPYVLAQEPMKTAELIGRLEVCKQMVFEEIWVSTDD